MTRRFTYLAAIALLVAAPVLAQGRSDRGRRGPRGPLGLLMIPEVQKELKMDPAQVDLVQGVARAGGDRNRGSGQDTRNMSREEREKLFAQARQEQEKKVAEILDKKQMARLKQLELQQSGLRSLDRKEVADVLKLTADQRQKVDAAIDGERTAMRAAVEGLRRNRANGDEAPRPDMTAVREKMEKLRTERDARLNLVLTDGQKKQWQSMLGAPFKFPERRPDRDRGTRPPRRTITN